MDPIALIKAILMNAACLNAVAVCEETQGGGVPIDQTFKDTGLTGKGILVYEEAKIQYAALLRGFQDKTGIWPDPQINASTLPIGGSSLTSLLPLVQKLLPLAGTIPQLAPFIPIAEAALGHLNASSQSPTAKLAPSLN